MAIVAAETAWKMAGTEGVTPDHIQHAAASIFIAMDRKGTAPKDEAAYHNRLKDALENAGLDGLPF